MTRVFVTATFWDGPALHLLGVDEDGREVALPWQGRFEWAVSEEQVRDEPDACVFEPRGLSEPGHHCWLCDKQSLIYMAFYGTLPKIGMTVHGRLAQRLREQGADAGFQVASCPDRATARRLEKRIAFAYGVPEWRRGRDVLPRLARPFDPDRIEARSEPWRDRLSHRFDPGPMVYIDDAPLPRPLPDRPHLVQARGRHEGTWMGAQGNHLFYRPASSRMRLDAGAVLALKRQGLEGRWVTAM